ncbi:hypothetical protein BS78_08G130400 [Paspalum vaginatum]|nr:hypothetical protein BS78_08G130400 [Paspalum vaginatum]
MEPKITDFGQSRLFSEHQSRTYTKSLVGTFGYMAREYLDRGIITKKADIFSLGVIVIEIITGYREYPQSTGKSMQDFIEMVVEKWKGRLEELGCTSLEDCEQIKICIEIGLRCVQINAAQRPATEEIIRILDRCDSTNLQVINKERTIEGQGHDGEVANGSISDATVAELEASMCGLQIIRNGDLEELRKLGSGTFGTVYHGKWRGADVAIKRINEISFSGRLSEQERLTHEFCREAQILSKLNHPNVVSFYGVVPDGPRGTLATVTEFMVGGSLRNVLSTKHRMLDRQRKLTIAMDAAFGMEYLHSKSIVHFDLKCDNLLVDLVDPHRPICKVGDFGLSKIKCNTLVSGGVRGTLPWMAPELLNGSSSRVSKKVDVFSFGIVLWEILTGEEPYADMHYGAIIGGIVTNTLRPRVPKNCDLAWQKLMEQCWAPNPYARPSFTEVANRLRAMPPVLQSSGSAWGTDKA